MRPLLLALVVLGAASGATLAQTGAALTGTWTGSGTLTNSWTDDEDPTIRLECAYVGKANPPSVTLLIGVGSLILNMPPPRDACPPLRKNFQIRPEISGTRLTFVDPAGDRWDLALTDDLLTGTVRWDREARRQDEDLFVGVGFAYAPPVIPWRHPKTRLTGKVTLVRVSR